MCSLKIASVLALVCVVTARNNPYHNQFEGGSNFGGYSGGYNGGSGTRIPILSYENVNDGNGNYRYSYETGNGISARESGSPRAPGPEGLAVTSEGGYSFRTPDGHQVSLTYTADENGFHPVGSHIPTPPPIPEAILKSLQLNRQSGSFGGNGAYNGNNGAYNGNNGAYNGNNGAYNGNNGAYNSGRFNNGGYNY